jgi:hypothetical protein
MAFRLVVSAALAVAVAASRVPAQCVGDCHNDKAVTVDELVMMVNIALDNAPMHICDAGDANEDGTITVDEIIMGVNYAMHGCPAPVSPDLERAAGAATSTSVALLIAVTELPVIGPDENAAALSTAALTRGLTDGPAWRLPLNARASDAGAAAPDPCPAGGTMDVSCRESGANSVLTAVMANCRIPDEETGLLLTSSGTFVATVASRGVCSTGVIPDKVRIVTHFTNFTSIFTDAGGTVVASLLLPDLTETFDPLGQGCAGSNGNLTLNGSYTITMADAGIDLSSVASNLTFQGGSSGTPCVLELTATGDLDVSDHSNDRHFTASFPGNRVTFAQGPEYSMLTSLDGSMSLSCIGDVVLQTETPLRLPGGGCASDGRLLVTLAGATTGRIDFTADGGVAFDYDADGTADKVVGDCRDPSVHQCR